MADNFDGPILTDHDYSQLPIGKFSIREDLKSKVLSAIKSGRATFEPGYIVKKRSEDGIIEEAELLEISLIMNYDDREEQE